MNFDKCNFSRVVADYSRICLHKMTSAFVPNASIESLVINLHCSSCCATVCLQLKTTMDCIEINEVKIRELRETVSSAS